MSRSSFSYILPYQIRPCSASKIVLARDMVAVLKMGVFIAIELAALGCLIGALKIDDPFSTRYEWLAGLYVALLIGGFAFGIGTNAI
jgi:hypothetical protein